MSSGVGRIRFSMAPSKSSSAAMDSFNIVSSSPKRISLLVKSTSDILSRKLPLIGMIASALAFVEGPPSGSKIGCYNEVLTFYSESFVTSKCGVSCFVRLSLSS